MENHLNRGKMGCFRSHIFSWFAYYYRIFVPQLSPSEASGDKIMSQTYFGHIQLKKLVKS